MTDTEFQQDVPAVGEPYIDEHCWNEEKLAEEPMSIEAKLCTEGVSWLSELTTNVSAPKDCDEGARSCSLD